jgi:hypothetical protein
MAKKKANRITVEDQRAFDERTRMIEERIEHLRRRIAARKRDPS